MSDSASEGNTSSGMASVDLVSLLSKPAVLIMLKGLIDKGIQEAREQIVSSRTGMSIDASGLESADSPLTNSSQSSSSNSSVSVCNAAIDKNKELSEIWYATTLHDVYSKINKPDRYHDIAKGLGIQELIDIRLNLFLF